MTTTVKIHVNGRYRAVVKQDGLAEPVEVHGNYEGSPNPSGEHTLSLVHGSLSNKFVISEYAVPEDVPEEQPAPEKGEAQEISAKDVGELPVGLRNPAT